MYFKKEPDHWVYKMTSSSFAYNCETVGYFLNKINFIMTYNDSMCDQYSMEYISELPNHFSKVVLQCVQTCTNITGNKSIDAYPNILLPRHGKFQQDDATSSYHPHFKYFGL